MARSKGVTKKLLRRLLRSQARQAEQERRLPYAKKLRILDGLMEEARRYGLYKDKGAEDT